MHLDEDIALRLDLPPNCSDGVVEWAYLIATSSPVAVIDPTLPSERRAAELCRSPVGIVWLRDYLVVNGVKGWTPPDAHMSISHHGNAAGVMP